ncbi:MAG: VanW family protein [Bacillota bacterium]
MRLLLALLMAIGINTPGSKVHLEYDGEKVLETNFQDFEMNPYPEYLINDTKLEELTSNLNVKLSKEPVDASLDQHGVIVGEQNGRTIDHTKFKIAFYKAFYNRGTTVLEIPTKLVYPKVDSELLEKIKRKRISHYVTYFNARNKERVHNIKLASEAINNYVVFPGETFSFNHVVGKRTVAKGYLPAPVIEKGELREGVGGGICQVSSTLFNAVDRAGVKVLERYSHSRRVPYVPPKRDATVSWYGPDFTFRNQHNQPLLIRSKVMNGQMIIMVFSSEDIDLDDIPNAPNQLE